MKFYSNPFTKTELMKAIDELEIRSRSIPKRIKMTTEYFESLKASIPVVTGVSRFDAFCGVPFVIDETVNGFEIEYDRQ